MAIPAGIRAFLDEPAVADAPRRVWRDWVLVAVAVGTAVAEAVLRDDAEWTSLSRAWQVAALLVFLISTPVALLGRRTHPLPAMLLGFVPTLAFGTVLALTQDGYAGVMATAFVLVIVYALYRWGSGRDGAWGVVILLAAWLVANPTDPYIGLSDWIGGLIVLSIPVEVGLVVRYRGAARERAVAEAKSRERADIARELHDTVAHHVSAIAVQAQAGRAIASSDPSRAADVLAVIEEEASRTLEEMRAMVGTLRAGSEAEMAPQQRVADLERLAASVRGEIEVEVDIADDLGDLGAPVEAAVFRIAQESLTNAVRHARHATRVGIRLAAVDGGVRLTVVDDGVTTDRAGGAGYGLLGMRERAELLGGRLDAGPVAPLGWQVTAELPRSGGAR